MTPSLQQVASRLIAFDTVSSKSNLAAIAFMAERLESAGLTVAMQEDEFFGVRKANLLASIGPPREGGLIVSGHVDTVPFEDQAGWDRDPLVLQVEDERVYGRGTSDMKVFLAQALCAAAQLDSGTLQRPLVFAFTYDEEVGCGGAARLAPEMARLLGDLPLPHIAWIGEPTSGRIFHAQKGSVVFQIHVAGRAAHSGTPAEGINAISAMARVLDIIGTYERELAARPRERYLDVFPSCPFPTLNVGTIGGGESLNTVPASCSVAIYYRPLPDEDPLEVYGEIERRVTSAPILPFGPSAGAAEVTLGPPFVMPGMLSKRDPTLEAALASATGTDGSSGAPYATDGSIFATAGIDSLICGPGDLDEAHRPNESIGRRAFEQGTAAILSIVRRVCG